jgi:hypothetical protein
MSNQTVSLTDIDGLIKAAEMESSLMTDDFSNSPDLRKCDQFDSNGVQITKSYENIINNTDEKCIVDGLPNNSNDIEAALSSVNISEILNQVSKNPDDLGKVLQESMAQMTPDRMEQARKLAMGNQGNQIMKQMKKKGINPQDLKKQLEEQQKALRKMGPINSTKRAVLITTSRQLKMRDVSTSSVQESVKHIINSGNAVEMSCSRMASGQLLGKTIKAWYDPQRQGKNTRASKIVGFPIAGNLLVIMDEGDLNEMDFIASEKKLF